VGDATVLIELMLEAVKRSVKPTGLAIAGPWFSIWTLKIASPGFPFAPSLAVSWMVRSALTSDVGCNKEIAVA